MGKLFPCFALLVPKATSRTQSFISEPKTKRRREIGGKRKAKKFPRSIRHIKPMEDPVILLMKEMLHQLIGILYCYLQGFIVMYIRGGARCLL